MNLDSIVGGSVNRGGGIDARDFRATGFNVNVNTGGVYSGYAPVGSIDSQGVVRDGYRNDTGVRLQHNTFIQDRSW